VGKILIKLRDVADFEQVFAGSEFSNQQQVLMGEDNSQKKLVDA